MISTETYLAQLAARVAERDAREAAKVAECKRHALAVLAQNRDYIARLPIGEVDDAS